MKRKLKLLCPHLVEEEKENTEIFKLINNPLLFLFSNKYIEKANYILPFSIGIEIECNRKETFKDYDFKSIPYLLAFNSDESETRFRIPNGVKGLISLYLTLELLKIHNELNPSSGIHYHIDMTSFYDKIPIIKNSAYILKELDTWNYLGTYNKREVTEDSKGKWVSLRSTFKTAEFRIGEMSFDYELILNRINHCSEIINTISSPTNITFDNNINIEDIKLYSNSVNFQNTKLINLLSSLKTRVINSKERSLEDIKEMIKNRVK